VLRHVATEKSDAIFASDEAIVIATLLDSGPDTVHLALDLRYIGLNIYADVTGLHVGDNLIAGNAVKDAGVAINLSE
jgi:hypothetical protein